MTDKEIYPHPGKWIDQMLEEFAIPVEVFTDELHMTECSEYITSLLDCSPFVNIDPLMACKLGHYFNKDPMFFLEMDAAFRLDYFKKGSSMSFIKDIKPLSVDRHPNIDVQMVEHHRKQPCLS